jgi:hypothetical protein
MLEGIGGKVGFTVGTLESISKITKTDYEGLSIKENGAIFNGKSYVVIDGVKVPLNGTSDELKEALEKTSLANPMASATELTLKEGFLPFAVDGDSENDEDLATLFDTREIEISANTFPGVYRVTGDTFVRNETTGEDEFFQVVLPKVKVLSETNTITMEAEGDPAVFSLSLKALKEKNGPLVELIQYTPESATVVENS